MTLRALTAAVCLSLATTTAGFAATYSFEFGNVVGDTAGTVTGTIDLGFINSPTGTGTGAADTITITSAPSGFLPLDQGNVVTQWSFQGPNTFSVVNGVISSYQFGATAVAATLSDDVICLNSGGFFWLTGAYACHENENFLGHYPGHVYNVSGAAGVTFEQISAVPLPAGGLLLLTGLGGIAAFERRKKHAA